LHHESKFDRGDRRRRVLATASASGETLDVTWTYTTDGTTHTEATWEQDSAPTPHFFLSGDGTSVPVSDFVSSAFPPRSFVSYYNQSGPLSGVMFSTSFGGGIQLLGSKQIYTGSETAPMFAPGSFSGLIRFDSGGELPSTLTFSRAVPEPSTWAMMLIGFAGLGFVGYRKSRKAVSIAG
jgi:PEP-CTERM motif